MGRYEPTVQVNRRRRVDDPPKIDTARVTTLGVFTILLGFFVGLVAWSQPNADKSNDLITTLKSTFKPVSNDTPGDLIATAPVPGWLQKTPDGTAPLTALQEQFPDAFTDSGDRWGAVQLRFTADRFQAFILGQPDLAKNLVSGFTRPADIMRGSDDYTLEVTIGLKGRTLNEARALSRKTKNDLAGLGVNPTRLLLGYESGSDAITIRMVQNDRYEGAQ